MVVFNELAEGFQKQPIKGLPAWDHVLTYWYKRQCIVGPASGLATGNGFKPWGL